MPVYFKCGGKHIWTDNDWGRNLPRAGEAVVFPNEGIHKRYVVEGVTYYPFATIVEVSGGWEDKS